MSVAFAGSWNEVVEHRPAFYGGVLGSAVTCALLVLGAMLVPGVGPEPDPSSEIEFQPAFIARLGIDDAIGNDPGTGVEATEVEAEVPAPEPVTEPNPEPTSENSVTKDPDVVPKPRKPRQPAKPTGGASKPTKLPGKLPSVGKGSPFADPKGFADSDAPGERWATDVMAALRNMQVGSFAAELDGKYRFKLTICPNGTIKRIANKGGSISASGRSKVRLALNQLDLPRPPARIRKLMGGRCQEVAHTFVWSKSKVK